MTFYWWYASHKYTLNRTGLENSGWKVSQSLIWVKEHFVLGMGQIYHRQYEPCLVGWKQGEKHYLNKEINNYSDVWQQKRDNTNEYLHPTQKSVELPAKAIKRSSKPKDLILDLFGGSGSTLMACE
ncbi:MAG: DNA methyltransferase, partial [Flammeovirgaceae bacterium]